MKIQNLLSSLSSSWGGRSDGDRFWLRCPFHRKNGLLERTPSFVINLVSNSKGKQGSGHCFGCGQNAKWEEIAKKIGITGNIDFDPSIDNLQNIKQKQKGSTLMDWNPSTKWRGISGKLLSYLNTKHFTNDKIDWIRIPVVQNKEEIGFIDARMFRKDHTIKGYYNSNGDWAKVALFGFDLAKKFNKQYIVVVEGPRDALHLLQHKIPAVAILGAYNINQTKAEILLANWNKIICAFDPDEAGDIATEKLKTFVYKKAKLRKIYFEPGTDAADLTLDEINELKTKFLQF